MDSADCGSLKRSDNNKQIEKQQTKNDFRTRLDRQDLKLRNILFLWRVGAREMWFWQHLWYDGKFQICKSPIDSHQGTLCVDTKMFWPHAP